jgi:hypothetical protein
MATQALRTADVVDDFSLVRGDLLFRAQRAIGLIPAQGLGVGRRTLLAMIVTWLPLEIAATLAHWLWAGETAEPLLQHYGVHVRFLVGVPLLILGDALAQTVCQRVVPHFVHSGIITTDRPRFVAAVERITAMRDGWRPAIVILGLVVSWALTGPTWNQHAPRWAVTDPPAAAAAAAFGLAWYNFVSRPIFSALLLLWLWRLILMTMLMWRVSRLDLALVPTHPDRAGGLGFVSVLPLAFAPPILATSAMLAGRWVHDAVYHDVPLAAFTTPLASFVIVAALAVLVPVLVFAPPLGAARRQALLDYGTLVGEHHRLVRRRWLFGERLRDDALLNAPELGPVADTIAMYDAVARMRPVPADRWVVITIAALLLLPMLPLVAVEVGLREALLKVVQTLLE